MRRAAAAAAAAAGAAAAAPEVRTRNGVVRGTALPGVNEFLGMRFATAARFEPPADFLGAYPTQPLPATDFAPACMQVGDLDNETYGSEDCLFANVWQPAGTSPGAGLPVVVFIYGGSNQFGETEPYNGSAFAARHNVVYASVSYRTGPMGWMAFDEEHAAGRSTGAYGMLDQQSGLRWVQRTIDAFGGDPSTTIIHGQSSGAACAMLHLVMPGSGALVSGIASESGGLSASPLAGGLRTARQIGALLNCTGSLKACLSRVDAESLTAQTYSFPWGPHADGVAIPGDPRTLLSQGRVNKVNVIMGAQTNDSNKGMVEYPMSVADYTRALKEEVGDSALDARALAIYPPDPHNLVRNIHTIGSARSDEMLCETRRTLSLINRANPGGAFMYRFNYWYQSNPRCTADPMWHNATTGPRHEDELCFVMGQPIFMFDGSCCGKWGGRLTREPCPQKAECVDCWDPSLGSGYHAYWDEKEWNFSQLVGGSWANLARSGTPNGDAAPGAAPWPVSAGGGDVTRNVVLDANVPGGWKQEGTLYDDPRVCALWDDASRARRAASRAPPVEGPAAAGPRRRVRRRT